MQVNLSSDNYNIISTGMAFLFGEDKDLTINIIADDGFEFSIIMNFKKDGSDNTRVENAFMERTIHLTCYNFNDSGTGMCWPVQIGVIGGKELYLIFWAYLDGKEERKARSVKYTLFLEK